MPDDTVLHTEALVHAFEAVVVSTPGTDWNELERRAVLACDMVETRTNPSKPDSVFLGGDALRPYLSIRYPQYVLVASLQTSHLTQPKLVRELSEGALGPYCETTRTSAAGIVRIHSLQVTENNITRFTTPRVMLISLTNADRYQTRRYPLGIARLAQWLRFQHVARVRVVDMALSYPNDVESLSGDIEATRPHILGVSLNFGELQTLQALVSHLRRTKFRPVLAIGNVLAAWATSEVSAICEGFEVFISLSYGESDLEEICARKVGFDRSQDIPSAESRRGSYPSVIVMPDEGILASTLAREGQASLETSFGCQYGRCTFCPRDHRSDGWRRPGATDVAAIIARMADVSEATTGTREGIISIVDEEAFGKESTSDAEPSIITILHAAREHGLRCEIYTRLEQLYHPRRERVAALKRLQQLRSVRPVLSRVFVGVESGCNEQLRRYGKGQTTEDIVSSLRAGSLLGLPMEYGLITFDPLLTTSELIANIEFLARRDVVLPEQDETDFEHILAIACGAHKVGSVGEPLFRQVAYMATELEVFGNSAYLRLLKRVAPQLVGPFDAGFARHACFYRDPVVEAAAAWCRVWTEGTFGHIYRIRLKQRSTGYLDAESADIVTRYRDATFGLLVALVRHGLDESHRARLVNSSQFVEPFESCGLEPVDVDSLNRLWSSVNGSDTISDTRHITFDLSRLELRRDT